MSAIAGVRLAGAALVFNAARAATLPLAGKVLTRRAHSLSYNGQLIKLPKSNAVKRRWGPAFSSSAAVERPMIALPSREGYSVNAAAFCLGKPQQQSNRRPRISCHPDCGEDAYFMCETSTHSYMGVADGVGGWQDMGIDPSLFSWTLVTNAQDVAESGKFTHPYEILNEAYERVVKEGKVLAGSSTACVVGINKQTGVLQCANIGDSGLRLIRDGRVVFSTREQQHFFNAPYQLAVVPPKLLKRGAIMDRPSDADVVEMNVESKDLVLLATDGMYDNLFDKDVEKHLTPFIERNEEDDGEFDSETAVKELVSFAMRMAEKRDRVSPFAEHARAHGYLVVGGKVDDITAILAHVC